MHAYWLHQAATALGRLGKPSNAWTAIFSLVHVGIV
jgi:hypothetical protein